MDQRHEPAASGAVQAVPARSRRAGLQLISRAAAVLRTLSAERSGLSLRQIARSSGLPRATVARIVDALEVEQFVIVDHAGVRLGPAIAALAGTSRIDVRELARPHLEWLAAVVQETVILTALRGRSAIYVDQVTSDRPINLSVNPGREFPLHATAAGKALLSVLPPADLAEFLAEPLAPFTDRTIISPATLAAELAEVARTGIAHDNCEHGNHDFALATAVLDPSGRPYSISILLPEARSGTDMLGYTSALLQCRARIAAALGNGSVHAGDNRDRSLTA